MDGEVEGEIQSPGDHDSIETLTTNSKRSSKKEIKIVSVQESIDVYQRHLNRIKKVNIDKTNEAELKDENVQANTTKPKNKETSSAEAEKETASLLEMKNKEADVETECLVKDEVCDTIEEMEEEIEDSTQVSSVNPDITSKESSKTESEDASEKMLLAKDKEEAMDSTKDSKSSSDQENAKLDTLKKFKKKSRGKFRLTTKTNKSKKFAVVHSDSYIKTLNKARIDETESSKENNKQSANEEQSLVLRKTERERPLSKRLLQKKFLRNKLKEIGKQLLDGKDQSNHGQITKKFSKPGRPSKATLEDLATKENGTVSQTDESENSYENSNQSVENVSKSRKAESSGSSSELPDSDEMVEDCIYVDECTLKFCSYFSMMRHVAFFHRPERTAELMKLKLKQ